MTSGCKDIGNRHIETSEFGKIELKSFLLCCFIQHYLQRIRLYWVVFDFHHKKWVIFNFFYSNGLFSTQPKLDVFPNKCTHLTFVLGDVCTNPSFVLVLHLYQSEVCKSNVCTVRPLLRPMFVDPRFALVSFQGLFT